MCFQLPFFPVVNKDLTFIDLGNDSVVEGLVNFEKLRMIAKEIRHICNMCSPEYVSIDGVLITQALSCLTCNYVSHGRCRWQG